MLRTAEAAMVEPIWVSSEAALQPDGAVDKSLLHEDDARLIQKFIDLPPGQNGCVELEEFYTSKINAPDRSTLEKAAQTSKAIVVGEVVDQAYGFSGGTPGQLFEVRAQQSLAGRLPIQSYYFFVPVGRFAVGDTEICKTDRRWQRVPRVGEEVALLVPRLSASGLHKRLPGEQFLYLDEAESLVIFGRPGEKAASVGARGPSFMKAMSKQEVLKSIRQTLRGE
ncbi:MAG: hypothetical protein AAGM22_21125 [Acidobacteriota bacterium]